VLELGLCIFIILVMRRGQRRGVEGPGSINNAGAAYYSYKPLMVQDDSFSAPPTLTRWSGGVDVDADEGRTATYTDGSHEPLLLSPEGDGEEAVRALSSEG
jgi:hypothetical protein